MTAIAVLGLGDAGGAIAADLRAAGGEVRGYDPLPGTGADAESAAAAAAGADLVLSLTTAEEAIAAARSVVDTLRPGQLYADANTSSAALKLELARLIEGTGALFADIALMAPVGGRGIRTPSLVSGPGAQMAVDLLAPFGMPIESLGAAPGEAARRKLLRSVLWKGLAAAILEATAAARAAGQERWMEDEAIALLESADAGLLAHMLEGSRRHAARRAEEMEAAADQLRELGVPARVSEATAGWLHQLDAEKRGAG